MRSHGGKLRARRCFPPVWLLLVALCGGVAEAQIQTQTQEPLQLPSPPGARLPIGRGQPDEPDPNLRHAQMEAAKQRNIERQTRLVSDTNKLLQLAQELKEEVDKSNKEVLSVAVVKKAEEIEKLAKSVKERMKAE
jgi:hypothetical protein